MALVLLPFLSGGLLARCPAIVTRAKEVLGEMPGPLCSASAGETGDGAQLSRFSLVVSGRCSLTSKEDTAFLD